MTHTKISLEIASFAHKSLTWVQSLIVFTLLFHRLFFGKRLFEVIIKGFYVTIGMP